jgi:hypothetical protein
MIGLKRADLQYTPGSQTGDSIAMIESPVSMTFLSDAGQDEQSSIANQALNDTSNVHGARDDDGLSLIDKAEVDKADEAQMDMSKGIMDVLKETLAMLLQMLLQWLVQGGDAGSGTKLESMDAGSGFTL